MVSVCRSRAYNVKTLLSGLGIEARQPIKLLKMNRITKDENSQVSPADGKPLLAEGRASEREHQLADKWIKELSDAGYTPDDMIAIFREARRKFEYHKRIKRMKELLGKVVPKLSNEQVRILDAVIDGAEIQKDYENGRYAYTLCKDNGDCETVRRDTFDKLKSVGLIKLKWRPTEDVERWG